LLREVWRAVLAVGLNPYYGFLHTRRPGRMSLVLDLMEKLRLIAVDRPLDKAQGDPVWLPVRPERIESQLRYSS
jgi:CRISPR-associated protein Cas1